MIPGFSETNVFDALYEALDRLDRIEGRKYIILIASGRDTFSKLTLDKILQEGEGHAATSPSSPSPPAARFAP